MLFSVVFAVQRHPLFCFSDFIAIRHFAVGRRITQGPGLPDPRPRATGPARGPGITQGPWLPDQRPRATGPASRRRRCGPATMDIFIATTVPQPTAAAISPLPPARWRRRYGRLLLLAAAIPVGG